MLSNAQEVRWLTLQEDRGGSLEPMSHAINFNGTLFVSMEDPNRLVRVSLDHDGIHMAETRNWRLNWNGAGMIEKFGRCIVSHGNRGLIQIYNPRTRRIVDRFRCRMLRCSKQWREWIVFGDVDSIIFYRAGKIRASIPISIDYVFDINCPQNGDIVLSSWSPGMCERLTPKSNISSRQSIDSLSPSLNTTVSIPRLFHFEPERTHFECIIDSKYALSYDTMLSLGRPKGRIFFWLLTGQDSGKIFDDIDDFCRDNIIFS